MAFSFNFHTNFKYFQLNNIFILKFLHIETKHQEKDGKEKNSEKKDNCKIKSIAIYKKVKYPYKDTTINCPLTATLKKIKKKNRKQKQNFQSKDTLEHFSAIKDETTNNSNS